MYSLRCAWPLSFFALLFQYYHLYEIRIQWVCVYTLHNMFIQLKGFSLNHCTQWSKQAHKARIGISQSFHWTWHCPLTSNVLWTNFSCTHVQAIICSCKCTCPPYIPASDTVWFSLVSSSCELVMYRCQRRVSSSLGTSKISRIFSWIISVKMYKFSSLLLTFSLPLPLSPSPSLSPPLLTNSVSTTEWMWLVFVKVRMYGQLKVNEIDFNLQVLHISTILHYTSI